MTAKLETPIRFVTIFWKGCFRMRSFLVLTSLACVVGIDAVEANDYHGYRHAYHHYHPEHDNSYHSYDCTRNSGYSYNLIHSVRVSPPRKPVDVFGTIGSHIVGMTTFLQKRLSDITTAVHRHLPKR